jgi:hypothetical protein
LTLDFWRGASLIATVKRAFLSYALFSFVTGSLLLVFRAVGARRPPRATTEKPAPEPVEKPAEP